LCDSDYYLCWDEFHLYEEWEELTRARPRYVSSMDGLIMEDDKQERSNKDNPYNDGADEDCSQAFFSGASPVDGVSSLALVLSGGGSPLLEVRGKSFCVSCLDFCYNCLNKNFVQCWYAYPLRTNDVLGFPLRTGFNGLEVDRWVDQKTWFHPVW
jgi:hypothetical protein